MRLPELLIVGCASLTLVGCALPRIDADASPPPAPAAPTQWQAPLPHNGAVSDLNRWWQDLGDPLLVELLEAAQQASPSLASARSRVIQSRAALGQARAAQGPTLDGSASAARSGEQVSVARCTAF